MNNFCVGCGRAFEAGWAFCPGCGAGRVDETDVAPTKEPPASSLRSEIDSLLDAGRLNEAEAVLRLRVAASPDVSALLLLSAVLSKQHRYSEGGNLLEDAIALDPTNAEAHLRRAEYRGRLGLYPQAIEDIDFARRHLPSAAVPALLHCQELERWLRDRAKSSFILHSELPRLPRRPSWLGGQKRKSVHPSVAG